MPEPQPNETQDEYMHRCVPMVMEDGTAQDNDQAVAICMSKWERKNIAPTDLKIGREISANNHAKIQAAHDALTELGAACKVPSETEMMPIMEKSLVAFGGEVKALGDTPEGLHVGGYLVRFSDAATPDLTGDYFTAETDFGLDEGEEKTIPVYFHHGQPLKTRDGGQITITRKIGKGKVKLDDAGLLIDAIIYNRDEYEAAISQQAKSLGWSSGALSHLVEREAKTQSTAFIKRWIIGEGSLTPTPAEPKNGVIPLKSFIAVETDEPAGEPQGTGDVPASEGEAVKAVDVNPIQPTTEVKMETTPEVQAIIEAAVGSAMKAFADKLPTNGNGGVVVTKDEGDQPWQSPGQFFKAVVDAGSNRAIDPRLYATKAPTGVGELVPADGGYLVPPAYAAGLIEKTYEAGSFLSLVARDPVAGNRMVYHGVDETSRATGSRQGGITGYWVAEAGSITGSKPKFREVDLKVNKVAALVYATDEMLADQNVLTGFLNRAVPAELRFLAEDAILNGNGVGKPQGILASNALLPITRDTVSIVSYQDIVNMWSHRWPAYKDYVWLCNTSVMPYLLTLTLSNSYAPPRFIDYGPDGILRILNRPVIEMEQCPVKSDPGDFMLVSPSQYQTIDKGGVEAASSIHVAFTTGEQAFRFTYRIDGAPLWGAPLTPFGGTTTNDQSPFVCLSSATT